MPRIGLISVFLLLTFYHTKAAIITSTATGGPWTLGTTWVGGKEPGGSDDVVISIGSAVLLNSNTVGSGIKSLTIQSGGSITLTGTDNIRLNVKGDIINNGTLNLWLNGNRGAALYILNNSIWSGNGVWNLAQVNIGANSVEFADDITVTINRKIDVDAGTGSLNMANQRPGITFIFAGTEKGTIPSQGDRVFYGNIEVRKTASNSGVSFTMTGTASSYNTISVLGDIIINSPLFVITYLEIFDFNTLEVKKNLSGNGRLIGGTKADLLINGSGPAAHINTAAGTLRNLTINRNTGAILDSSLAVVQTLTLNNSCRLILPSGNNFNLTIGSASTAGTVTGNGFLVQPAWTLIKELADITIKGNAANVDLRFSQTGTENIIHDLTIDKTAGVVNLLDGGSLQVRNTFIFTKGIFSIGSGTLKLTGLISTTVNGVLRGSVNAGLFVGNEVSAGSATLYFDQTDASSQTFKTYRQLRNNTVTLGNNLNIVESVDLSGGIASNILNSNGKLTLLSTASQTAFVNNLGLSKINGDVTVQRFLTGENNIENRGYRLLSSPVNVDMKTDGTGSFNPGYIKQSAFVSGKNGEANGFHPSQRNNPTLYMYREDVLPSNASFNAGNFKGIEKIGLSTEVYGSGEVQLPVANGLFFYFVGDNNPATFTTKGSISVAPESVILAVTGTVNQKQVPVKLWFKTSNGLSYTANIANQNARGFNLIGNPYPCAIDWSMLNSTSNTTGIYGKNIQLAIWTLKPGTKVYSTYKDGDAVNDGNPIISSGQGFFVKATGAGAELVFNETAKTTQHVFPLKFLGKPEQEKRQYFKLSLEKDSMEKDEVLVRLMANADAGYNEQEDVLDLGGHGNSVSLSTLSADKRVQLAMNYLPEKTTTIPLRFSANVSGNYILSCHEMQNLTGFTIWLIDTFKKDSVELKKNTAYTFHINKTDTATFGDNRLSVHLQKTVLKVEEKMIVKTATVQVYPNPATDFFSLAWPKEWLIKNPVIQITSIMGRNLWPIFKKVSAGEKIDIRPLTKGTYTVSLYDSFTKGKTYNVWLIKL